MGHQTTSSFHNVLAAATCAAALAGCGGGGSDTPTAPITVAGTAAKGAALPGATVSIRCAVGAGTATTSADGRYTLAMTNASLPCALKVVGTDGSVFHSAVAGTGGSGTFTANISPLTELAVAAATLTAPGAFFDGVTGSTVLTTASLIQALDYLRVAVAGVTDLTDTNVMTDALVPGNALDQKIEAVVASFDTAGVSLGEATAAVFANPAAPTVLGAALAPVASSCAWLKQGRYRMVNPAETDPRWRAHVLQVDPIVLTVTDQDNATLSMTSNGACQFTVDEAEALHTVMVSAGGMLVVHSQSKAVSTDRTLTFGLPEQTLPISEFAGTWNVASWDPHSGIATPGYVAQSQQVTLDATGQVTAASECLGLAACVAGTAPFPRLMANTAAGGFDLVEDGSINARVFMFKTLAGKAVVVFAADDGQFFIASRQVPLGALPAVGTVTNYRQVTWNGNGSISTLNEDTTTIVGSSAFDNAVSRLQASTNRIDWLGFDVPRAGLRYRAANNCTIDGAPSNCAQIVQLPLQGMGITLTMSVGTDPASAFYQAAINKPN